MNEFISKTKSFIFAKQKSIVASALLLSGTIVLARFFGFFRYRVLANYFTKGQLDIFFASFRIPDLIFEILITGAFTSSFIPLFVKYQGNKKELDENISSIINLILLFMMCGIVILFIFMDPIMRAITPGFSLEKTETIVLFSRILLIGQLPFLIFGNFLTGIGQADKTFFLSAIAPVFYNITIIISTVLFTKTLFLMAPIVGVIIGAFFLFAIQVPIMLSTQYTYRFVLKKTQGLVEFVHMVVPRTLTVIVSQIDATIDLTLTTLLGSGSYTVFYLAQRLQLLPVSVIGVAFCQASLPYLSEIFTEKRIEEFKKIILDSVLNLFFLTIPIMSFFVFARTPIIRLFFGAQKFDWDATVQTAITLSYFALSIPFHGIYYFLTRCFYAILDSRTPFFIGVSSIVMNTALSLYFIFILKLPVWALSISFSVSMIINVIVLFVILGSRLRGFSYKNILFEIIKMTFASLLASVVSYISIKLMDKFLLDTSRTINVFVLLCVSGSIFSALYLFLAWVMDIKELYLVTRLLVKAKEYHKRFLEIYTQYE